MSDGLLRKVQSIQNAAARLVTGSRRCDHITPLLRQLHWLPVRQRVEYNVACLVHQSLAGQTPTYIADDIQLVTDSDRCFGAAGPRMSNSTCDETWTLRVSSVNWKHFCSGVSQPRRIVTVCLFCALEILLLTYLLSLAAALNLHWHSGHPRRRYQKFFWYPKRVYFTVSNDIFKFNFLALVVSEILRGHKCILGGPAPPDAP